MTALSLYFGTGFFFEEEGEDLVDFLFLVFAGGDEVDHAVGEEVFGFLEAFGQRLADGLFDDARASEADEGLGFGDVDVSLHGKAGGGAAGGGVGEEDEVG